MALKPLTRRGDDGKFSKTEDLLQPKKFSKKGLFYGVLMSAVRSNLCFICFIPFKMLKQILMVYSANHKNRTKTVSSKSNPALPPAKDAFRETCKNACCPQTMFSLNVLMTDIAARD